MFADIDILSMLGVIVIMNTKKIMSILFITCFLIPWILFPFEIEKVGASCPPWAIASPKGNYLYLYFPTSSDSSFPEYGGSYSASTSPVPAFDVADLDGGIGTTANLRDAIFDMVTEDYCEFNVKVFQTTTLPTPSVARWQIVGIGTDSQAYGTGVLFGLAQDVDTGDSDGQDYGRVWAASFLDAYGYTGGPLEGSDSTFVRWTTAIAETTAHEAGHNYGLSHGNSAPKAGSSEDAAENHILATYPTIDGDDRAGIDRHFSDTSYEILGYNLGLNVETLHNWDFVNPNDQNAYGLQMKILSQASSLSIGWYYQGSLSPWTNPSITKLSGTESFQGDTYNVFEFEMKDPKSWSGGSSGIAPPAAKIHVGVSFNEPDAIIIRETILLDNSDNPLPLAPRLFGYDAGTADLSSGDFAVTLFNDNSGGNASQDLILSNLEVFFVPRMIDIETMLEGAELLGLNGLPIQATRINDTGFQQGLEIRDKASFNIAHLADKRSVDITYDCPDRISDTNDTHIPYCPTGTQLSLFPSTYVYLIATAVDPSATYWDPQQQDFVTGELESKIFYQFSGFIPDFNENGQDDLLDIRFGNSTDDNENGVPDDAERSPFFAFEIIPAILIFSTLLIVSVIYRRRKN